MADYFGNPPPIVTPPGHRPIARIASPDVLQASVPVRATSGTLRTLLQVTLPDVDPGDTVVVTGRSVLTNDAGYTVGLGGEIRMWDATQTYTVTWEKINPYVSDNVQTARHHIPILTTAEWSVPSTWVPGTPMTVALLVSAFSDSSLRQSADTLIVEDGYGLLQAERWGADQVIADVLTRLEVTETALADHASRLTALEAP